MLRLTGRPYAKEAYCELSDDSKSGWHSSDISQRSFRDSGSGWLRLYDSSDEEQDKPREKATYRVNSNPT